MFSDILEEKEFEGIESFEEFQEAVDRRIADYNRTPQKELGGLTPEQVDALLVSDWSSSANPMEINESLPVELVRQVRIVKNSRIFLETARDRDGLPSTKAGNLKRRAVADFLGKMKFNPDRVEGIRKNHTVINENHVRPLNILRVFLESAGLVERRDGKFQPTTRGITLLEPERASELMNYLFYSYFREFQLNYSTGCQEWDEFRQILPYSLYRLAEFDDEWHRVDTVADRALLPSVFDLADRRGDERVDHTFAVLILDPLCKFELLDGRKLGVKGIEDFDPQYRKTPLFDRYIKFDLA